jgi:signal recognition particle subunit SRP72
MADVDEVQKLYKDLRKLVKRENYKKALNICTQLRKKVPAADEPVVCHCVCLLYQEQWQKALDVAEKALGGGARSAASFLLLERAYCLYKLQRLDEALSLIGGADAGATDGVALQHLQAQVLYRQAKFGDAVAIYNGVLAHEDDPTETLSNLAAACVLGGRSGEALEAVPEDFVAKASKHELAYNLSIAAADSGDLALAEQRLQQAESTARAVLAEDGWDAAEIEGEVACVLCQLAYVVQRGGDGARAAKIYKSVLKAGPNDKALVAVASNNLAALRGERDLFNNLKLVGRAAAPEAKLAERAREAVARNQALLALYGNKFDECRKAVAALEQSFPNGDVAARSVLRAALLLREGKHAEAEAALSALGPENEEAQLTLAHVLLTRGETARAAAVLRAVPALQHRPGTVATLVAMYADAGDDETARAVFDAALTDDAAKKPASAGEVQMRSAAARFMLDRGLHEEAAAAYQAIAEAATGTAREAEAVAELVLALTRCGTEAALGRAEEWAAKLPAPEAAGPEEDEELLDAEALESAAPLRALSRRLQAKGAAVVKLGDGGGLAGGAKKKLPNAARAAKKRAKLRARHVAKLEARLAAAPAGPGKAQKLPEPDKELWTPRRERASYLKKRRGGARTSSTSAQGGAALSRDVAKLDARARKESELSNPAQKVVKGVLNTSRDAMSRKSGRKKKK